MKGSRFGKIIVQGEISKECRPKAGGRNWLCLCDCGNTCVKTTSELNSGLGKSCGCITKTHGMSGNRQYSIWNDMRRRCRKEHNRAYKNYGLRGIDYPSKWETFDGFWEDMGDSYRDNLTLERIDVNKGYSKDNCCWVPKEEQAKNKRIYSNNSLGLPNMQIVNNKGIPTLKVRIQQTDTKKIHSKHFSLALYTKEEAIAMAQEWLEDKRLELGYKETHGS